MSSTTQDTAAPDPRMDAQFRRLTRPQQQWAVKKFGELVRAIFPDTAQNAPGCEAAADGQSIGPGGATQQRGKGKATRG